MEEITQDLIKSLLDYNYDTGVFTWKEREASLFSKPRDMLGWNKRYSKKEAGYPTVYGRNKYHRIGIFGGKYFAHRLAWLYVFGSWPINQIDHINGDGLDNRIFNLRSVTVQENGKNIRLPKNNTSGVIGVCWDKQYSKWKAYMVIKGKYKVIGIFDDLALAKEARKKAEKENGYHENHGKA